MNTNWSLPAPARLLLDFIGSLEAPHGYETIYGNHQSSLPQPITAMTLDEVLAAQPQWRKKWKNSAAGRYQFIPDTLKGLKHDLALSGGERFDAALQDRLGFELLQRRGYAAFIAGVVAPAIFALHLAQEWASIPLLVAAKRGRVSLRRGQSYYDGVAGNSALTSPEHLEAELQLALAARGAPLSAATGAPDPDSGIAKKLAPRPPLSQQTAILAPGDFPMPKNIDVLASHPKILDLIMKAATTAAGIAANAKGGNLSDIVGKAIGATLTSPSVSDAAADASEAVNTIPTEAKKPWWKSLTINASTAGIVASLAGLAGLTLTGGDVETLVTEGAAIATAVTSIIAIIGRLRAKTVVG